MRDGRLRLRFYILHPLVLTNPSVSGIFLQVGKVIGRHIFGTVKVGEKGQIVIPKEARDQFGIRPGDTLLVLGDDRHGIVITRPDVIEDVAERIFDHLNEGKE